MQLKFTKYQGTGNDFVIIDNRQSFFPKDDPSLIPRLCDRKFGIGADGLMLIEEDDKSDFQMIYYNADGSKSLCGNGSRCSVDFAKELGIISENTMFETTDGQHNAFFKDGWVYFQLRDVDGLKQNEGSFFIENGSPHHVEFVNDVESVDVVGLGSAIRNSEQYKPNGTNVNFAEIEGDVIKVRTYERGVENETLSCGTGVTAVALAASFKGQTSPIHIETPGGSLSVSFIKTGESFTNIYLAGPATKVFSGEIAI